MTYWIGGRYNKEIMSLIVAFAGYWLSPFIIPFLSSVKDLSEQTVEIGGVINDYVRGRYSTGLEISVVMRVAFDS